MIPGINCRFCQALRTGRDGLRRLRFLQRHGDPVLFSAVYYYHTVPRHCDLEFFDRAGGRNDIAMSHCAACGVASSSLNRM